MKLPLMKDPVDKRRLVHMAKMIRDDGAVSPLCTEKPRVLDLSKSSWTNRKKAVTCKKCLTKIQDAIDNEKI